MEPLNEWIIVGDVVTIDKLIEGGFSRENIALLSANYSHAKQINFFTEKKEEHKFSGIAACFYGYLEQDAIIEDKKVDILTKFTTKVSNMAISEDPVRTKLVEQLYSISDYNKFQHIPENLCVSLRVFSIENKLLNYEELNSPLASLILRRVSIIYHPDTFTAFLLYDHLQYDKVEHYYLRNFKSYPKPDNLYSANYYLKKYANMLLNGCSESLQSCKTIICEHLTKLEDSKIDSELDKVLNGDEDSTAINASKIVDSVIERVNYLKNTLKYLDYRIVNSTKANCSICGKNQNNTTICFDVQGKVICILDFYTQLSALSNQSAQSEKKELMLCLQILEPSLIKD